MMDLPSSDQASSEGPALISIVGNNTERGVESVLSNSFAIPSRFIIQFILQMLTINLYVSTI